MPPGRCWYKQGQETADRNPFPRRPWLVVRPFLHPAPPPLQALHLLTLLKDGTWPGVDVALVVLERLPEVGGVVPGGDDDERLYLTCGLEEKLKPVNRCQELSLQSDGRGVGGTSGWKAVCVADVGHCG